jgi:23S rRNA (adenine2503-C2)-methyltransferase
MVGCPVNCSFCATGKLGFGGNLDSREIIDQVLHFGRILKSENQKITNVVFMGMGEPLLNLQNILSAIQILSDPSKFNLGSRRITISTSGYIPQLQQLIDSGFRGRLAISLHAPNQELRSILMPVAKVYPLDKLLKTLDGYTKLTGKRISYEYILIDQVTDDLEQAKQLVDLFKHRLAHINLIPYNPIPNSEFVRPSKNRIHEFSHVLEQADIPHTIRVTMGDDISAACGQLARNYQNKY